MGPVCWPSSLRVPHPPCPLCAIGYAPELRDKRWFGFEIKHLLMARLFRIQYQNQYLCLLEIITDTDINIAQWVIFEF